jgi:mono/diheme cytochrome c family protein
MVSRSLCRAVACSFFTCSAFVVIARPAGAQQPQNPLPAAVREWMETDQLNRWARMIQIGDSLFNKGTCMRCHGERGVGGERAPNLTDAEWVQSDGSLEGIRETIFWGVRRKDMKDTSRPFEMNPGGGMDISWESIRAVAAYVWSLNNGTFLPQRR